MKSLGPFWGSGAAVRAKLLHRNSPSLGRGPEVEAEVIRAGIKGWGQGVGRPEIVVPSRSRWKAGVHWGTRI